MKFKFTTLVACSANCFNTQYSGPSTFNQSVVSVFRCHWAVGLNNQTPVELDTMVLIPG